MRSIIVLMCLAVAHIAAAQPTTASVKAAREHFIRGEALVKAERFDDAIREFEAAYELDPQPIHIYNFGVAHHLRGDEAIALDYYRLYLLDGPTGKEARNATRYSNALEMKVAERRAETTRKELANAQASSAANATSVEEIIYAQYLADAENKQARIALVDAHMQASRAETLALRKRTEELLAAATAAAGEARRWERYARRAPTGNGSIRRVAGLALIGLGAAALTMGIHDSAAGGADVGVPQYAALYAVPGAVALLTGLVLTASGEIAADRARSTTTFERMRLVPTVGRDGGGLSFDAAF